jgi:hypothetical protein
MLPDPPTPDGYDLVFGPINRASSGPGVSQYHSYRDESYLLMKYMGYTALQSYDVGASASFCNTRELDSNGGACQFLNIWVGVVNNITTSYSCSMVCSRHMGQR